MTTPFSLSSLQNTKNGTAASITHVFLDYFQEHGHTVVCPSSLIPPNNDKSLLFTNSGMNQFKRVLLGEEDPKVTYACNSQVCARLGGKHNDLHDVGRDTYHHTLFHMLGNWSFGMQPKSSYKRDAITHAWRLLTERYKLDPSRMYVTYFGGEGDVPSDDETKQIWLEFMDEKRLLPFGFKDNFWEMASTGPCGCCCEIHYDLIGDRDGTQLVNKSDPTVVELWNIVFISYQRHENKSLTELKHCSVDTGMGLERLAMILQQKTSNYDTSLFQPFYEIIYEETKVAVSTSAYTQVAYRVISDHVRAMIYMLKDDIAPYYEDRGSMWVKLLKRSCLHLYTSLHARRNALATISQRMMQFLSMEDDKIKKTQNLMFYIFNNEENKLGMIWKAAVPFRRLLMDQKEDKQQFDSPSVNRTSDQINIRTLKKKEFNTLTRDRNIPVEVVQQFVLDFDFCMEV